MSKRMTKMKLMAGAVVAVAAAVPSVASAQTRPGCESCPGSCDANYSYEYFPGYISNAVEGDLLMHLSVSVTKSLLDGISAAIGRGSARYTHVGTITKGGAEVTHNTMYSDNLVPLVGDIGARAAQWVYSVGWNDVKTDGDIDTAGLGALVLDGAALYHGAPGSHTANAQTELMPDGSLYWERNAALVKPRDEGAQRHKAFRIADRERTQTYLYSIHAFMNPAGETGKGASVCSLDVRNSSLQVGYGEPQETYNSSAMQSGVNAGYNFVKAQAEAAINNQIIKCICNNPMKTCSVTPQNTITGCDSLGYQYWRISSVPGGTTFAANAAAGIANQISNCFKNGGGSANSCTDWLSTSWASMGQATTITPDTILANLTGGTYKSVTTAATWAGAGYRSYDNGTGRCRASSEY